MLDNGKYADFVTYKDLGELIEEIMQTQYENKSDIIEKCKSIVGSIFGIDSYQFKDFEKIHYGMQIFTDNTTKADFTNHWERSDKKTMTSKLKGYIEALKLKANDSIDSNQESSKKITETTDVNINTGNKVNNTNIFIVHGHDHGMKETVARFIEHIDLIPIILHEQANEGKTIIEKFESHADNVQFAIILLSSDDKGKGNTENRYNPRTRQNVILEMGYFIGKLGRNRVFPLYKPEKDFETPSDILGVIYTEFDNANTWKTKLLKELSNLNYNIDASKLIKQ